MAKYIDLHSHIAWGIDDGMPSIEDAVSSLESAKKDESYPYLFWWGSYDE